MDVFELSIERRRGVPAMEGRLAVGGIEIDSSVRSQLDPGKSLKLGLRPEHLDEREGVGLEATVEFVESMGNRGRLARMASR